ncbi:MAG TPA: chemotaxis protein CheB [Kofleriaceae bacterium]|jgi:two-component system CheB/CheR fusion protein
MDDLERRGHVVGIGASAGGLEALEHFFDNVSADTELAFVVVQHLSPDFKSLMDELLGRHTQLPIHLVEDAMLVERGHVYLIPPKKEMIISGGRLLLTERDLQQELALPIDVFFRSLAQDCGPGAIAVVLSGSGSDGSRGICDVHAAGGTVIVQDLDSAQFSGMPRTATETGIVDFILAPQNMPRVLEERARHGTSLEARPDTAPPRTARSLAFADVYRLLETEFGIDFTHYKPSTVTRRIERRLRLSDLDGIEQYVEHLRKERTELDVLYRDLLIGVTRFFRNEEAFAVLQKKVLPQLIANVAPTQPIRVWVAGCATGEEPYSIAILLHELLAHVPGRSFKIFATDMHRGSLELAARGFFGAAALANVSQERKDRYFIKSGASYQLLPELRQSIVFAPHNVIKDAPFTRVDLVSCRNMLIYLQPAVQQKVLNQFHFALNRGGVMFLGPSESPGALLKDFETIDAHWRMYRKHSDVRTPVDPRLQPRSTLRATPTPITGPFARYSMSHLLATYDALLEDFMPSSLLVNDRGELVHAFRGASQFLKPRDGRQGLEVSELVEDQLKPLITGGLRRALMSPAPLTFKNVSLKLDGADQVFHIGLRRVSPRHTEVPHVLITFEQLDGPVAPPVAAPTELDVGQLSRDQLGSLQNELDYTKENLQSAIEQLEAGNEELQASNEELMSSNEELQSTNEELQSVNEELYTVNAEYQSKIGELTELTNDMDNLLASTEIATIFLDEKLRIRKFTPQVAETFNLLPQDVGRSIETFTSTIDHPELAADIRRVLATTERLEREVRDQHGRALFLRILPYRAKGGTAGAVITFVDVSGLKAAEDALFHERYLLNSLLASVPDAIYFRDTRGRFIRTNPAATVRLGLESPAQAVGKTPFELTDPQTAIAMYKKDDDVLRTGQPQLYELEKWSRPDGKIEWDLVTRLPLVDGSKATVGTIGIARDVTAQKVAEEKIQEAVRRRDEFLAMLSHELRNPLAAVVAATELMKSDLSKVAEQPALVDVLDRQTHQMARLLDDLLDASRVTQNKIELRMSPLDVRTVVNDAVSASRALVDSQGLTLAVALGDAPLNVMADPSRLQQVYANLFTNAAKYTPSGGHVWIEAMTDGNHAVVRVRDDGVGIAPDMLDAIFDLFVQPNRTLERSQGGLGVGLTLARSLVAMHGGTLHAESDGEGKGSTFSVRLPLSTARPAQEAPRPATKVSKGARVVVVEDNVDAREMLCHLLTKAGFACESVGDGLEAVDLIETFKPQAAIVDVGLPGIDGFEVARRVRTIPALEKVVLIALTGYGQHNDRAKAREVGFDEHMVKPVKFEELMKLLTKVSSSERREPVV